MMPAMSGSSPSSVDERFCLSTARAARRAAFSCCFSRLACSRLRLLMEGRPVIAMGHLLAREPPRSVAAATATTTAAATAAAAAATTAAAAAAATGALLRFVDLEVAAVELLAVPLGD